MSVATLDPTELRRRLEAPTPPMVANALSKLPDNRGPRYDEMRFVTGLGA